MNKQQEQLDVWWTLHYCSAQGEKSAARYDNFFLLMKNWWHDYARCTPMRVTNQFKDGMQWVDERGDSYRIEKGKG